MSNVYDSSARSGGLAIGIIMFTFKKNQQLFFTLLFIFAIFKFSQIDHNEKFLNFFAKYYFDEEYYIQEYPDISKHKLSPFEHYVQIGWHENKNPNTNFDTKFYKNMYLIKHLVSSKVYCNTV